MRQMASLGQAPDRQGDQYTERRLERVKEKGDEGEGKRGRGRGRRQRDALARVRTKGGEDKTDWGAAVRGRMARQRGRRRQAGWIRKRKWTRSAATLSGSVRCRGRPAAGVARSTKGRQSVDGRGLWLVSGAARRQRTLMSKPPSKEATKRKPNFVFCLMRQHSPSRSPKETATLWRATITFPYLLPLFKCQPSTGATTAA